ncbi:hypothetical protein LTR04_001012 [Oleoguttula sp. CCFEE 6159]|nr:hypothetical protein LTR04_001012 [Oleoguttula sp. CCFEE 6159]
MSGHKIQKMDVYGLFGLSQKCEPSFGIGQRCILLQTPDGNVLWDVIALLDQKTIQFINSKGGLKAIVISHPHYYTTHLEWALAFGCPVYVSVEDKEWLCRADPSNVRHFIKGPTEQLSTGVTAIKAGGHFPGSLLLHWEKQLFIADTIVIIPRTSRLNYADMNASSGVYHIDRLQGTTSFAFMWSIPNMIPLSPDEIQGIWNSLKPFDFDVARGAFVNMDIRSKEVKARVLESMKVHVRRVQSNESCALLEEAV